MLGKELEQRTNKLKLEQKERLEKAKQRQEKEKALQERLRQHRAAEETEASERRLAVAAAAEVDRLQHEEEVEQNNGVWWSARLDAYAIDEDMSKQRGIRRGADKVVLPTSVGNLLMQQDAPKNGPQFFELRTDTGGRTHAGVLEFTGREGMIGVPAQVARNLWGETGVPEGGARVLVTYRRLQKGTYTQLQPRSADFQKEAGEAMEAILEAALRVRSTLTVGDWVSAQLGEQTYDLRVNRLQPAGQVSVIDTDLEASVEPSVETEERIKAEEAAAQKRMADLARLAQIEADRRRAEEAAASARAADLDRVRQAQEASLLPEPEPGTPGLTMLVRLPDGARISRRFPTAAPLSQLFAFVDARSNVTPDAYRLVTQFPRRVIEHHAAGATLAEAGFGPGQEMLLVEPVQPAVS